MVQFSSQLCFLILMVGLSMVLSWDDVMTAQVSQGINSVTVAISFLLGWRLMPKYGARSTMPQGGWLVFQGFRQNWETVKRIQSQYKKSLGWFLLALVLAESCANTFTVVAVVFLDEELGLSGGEIGLFFVIALLGMIPGGKLGGMVTKWTNPNTSWRLALTILFLLGVLGGLVLNRENARTLGYGWGFLVGLNLGWHYPTSGLFFSMIIPEGQEAELSGFFVYCTQIIGWLPPLLFSIMVEKDIKQGYGVIVTAGFALVAVVLLSMAPSWPDIVRDVHGDGWDEELPIEKEGPEATEATMVGIADPTEATCGDMDAKGSDDESLEQGLVDRDDGMEPDGSFRCQVDLEDDNESRTSRRGSMNKKEARLSIISL